MRNAKKIIRSMLLAHVSPKRRQAMALRPPSTQNHDNWKDNLQMESHVSPDCTVAFRVHPSIATTAFFTNGLDIEQTERGFQPVR